jgi:hypothetical protein
MTLGLITNEVAVISPEGELALEGLNDDVSNDSHRRKH